MKTPMEVEEKVVDVASLPKYRINVLQTIKTQQSTHGIRSNEYGRYRKYCARRLRRVRRSLKLGQGRKTYAKRDVTAENLEDGRALMIPLLLAERAWSHAMERSQDQDENGRARFAVSKRMTRASKWANELETICKLRGEPIAQLESQAYAAWLRATLAMERGQFSMAQKQFNKAKNVYNNLRKVTEGSRALYDERIQTIQDQLDVVQYNIDRHGADDVGMEVSPKGEDDTMANAMQTLESQMSNQTAAETVTWKGNEIPLHNEKIIEFLSRLEQFKKSLKSFDGAGQEENRLSTYLQIYTTCEQAVQYILTEQAELASSQVRSRHTDIAGEQLQALLEMMQFETQKTMIRRHLELANMLSKHVFGATKQRKRRRGTPAELIYLYEQLINATESLAEVGDSAVDKALSAEVEAARQIFEAYRTFFIGVSHAAAKKWANAYSLFERCEEDVSGAMAELGNVTWSSIPDLGESCDTLLAATQKQKLLAHGQGIYSMEQDEKQSRDRIQELKLDAPDTPRCAPLMDRLSEYDAGNPDDGCSIVKFPPGLRPMPCKPIFYDVAANSIEYPDLSHRILEKQQGFFGGLFG